jgi:hypothetical protein
MAPPRIVTGPGDCSPKRSLARAETIAAAYQGSTAAATGNKVPPRRVQDPRS